MLTNRGQRKGETGKKMTVILGGLTSHLQSLGISINNLFKTFMKEEQNQWMTVKDHNLTSTGRLKRPTIQVCEWDLK